MDLNSKELGKSSEEGEEEVVEATDCIRLVANIARAEETDARASITSCDLGPRAAQAKDEASLTPSLPADGRENAAEEAEAVGAAAQSQKKKRKRKKKKKRDPETASAASAVTDCDAIVEESDVIKPASPDSAEQLNNLEEDRVHSAPSADQDQTDSKKKRRSRKRRGKSAQVKEETAPVQVQEDMAKGDSVSANLVAEDDNEQRQDTPTPENASSRKKKRNRRKKAGKVHGEGESPEATCSGEVNQLHNKAPNSIQHQETRSVNQTTPKSQSRPEATCSGEVNQLHNKAPNSIQHRETRSVNQTTPKSHERSGMRNSPHSTFKTKGNKRRPLYEQFWPVEKVSAGLKRGELVKGVLRINPRNYELAWVTVAGLGRDVLIEGMLRRNRALNGDVVALEILPRNDWKIMKAELDYNGLSLENHDEEHANVDNVTLNLDKMSMSNGEEPHSPEIPSKSHHITVEELPEQYLQKTAKVVHIIEKKHSRVASGHLKPFPHPKECPDGLFSPVDSRLPRIRIPRENCPPGFFDRPRDFQNTLLVARIISWPETSSKDSFLAIGTIARSLGEAGEIEPETEGILLEYGIDSGPFSDEALACLPLETPWKIPEQELGYRRDFREDCVFTIDPLTARDLDDAVHCKKLEDSLFEVGVHIADVSFFVRRGTALDEVAVERGTSTYMVQTVVPMLPRRLCEELCSLNPGEDRLTFSVVWKMTDKGEILDEWKGRGIIRSRVKMAYEHAQDMIDKPNRKWNPNELPPISDGASVEEISAQVNQLHKFAVRLRRNRFENGALRLDQVKIRFDLDQETGLPNGYHVHKQRDANKLIEEFMLLANMAVAHHIYTVYPETALLRRHPKPHQKQLDDLLELCKSFGINFNCTSSKTIHESLAQFPLGSPEREVLVNLTMRPMKNAEYFCTGSVEEGEYGHYALSVPLYTHFTSPIRRYPDIVVHRLLAASLGIDQPLNQDPAIVDMIAEHCNDRKLAAKRASELSNEMFFGIFVRESGPLEQEGMVLNVMDQSLDVLVPELGVVKRVYMKFCPGVKSFTFTKGVKGKPAEMCLLWSVKLKTTNATYEEEQEVKIFNQVRVILTTESATETKASQPFKVMAKLVPSLKCGDEYYVPSTPSVDKSLKKKNAASSSTETGSPNTLDDVRKKLFDSEQNQASHHGSDVTSESKRSADVISVNGKCDDETASRDSDDVIVESEEEDETSKLANEATKSADDSDDVIVESEGDD